MNDDFLIELKKARKELEDIATELKIDILSIIGPERVSLNETFPIILKEKSKDISRENLLRFFLSFFNFQRLTLICLDRVILTSLNESIKNTFEKKRELENEIWKNYFNKLMGEKD